MSIEVEQGPLLVVDSDDVRRFATPALAREAAVRAAHAQQRDDTHVGRVTLPFPGGWIRLMGASIPAMGVVGYKQFHLAGAGLVRYAVHLFAIEDGRPLGIVDGALLTPLRTAGAAAALAASYFRDGSRRLRVGIIGSSTEAEAGLTALVDALPVADVRVTSRRATSREGFATRMSEALDVPIEPVPDATALAVDTDVVYVATASGGHVVVDRPALSPVPLVLSIGSTLPEQRELDGPVMGEADLLVVDTPDVFHESGDALAAGCQLDDDGVRLLGDYLADPGSPIDQTVYKSIGSPEQDIVLAATLLELAEERGFGTLRDPLVAVKRNR